MTVLVCLSLTSQGQTFTFKFHFDDYSGGSYTYYVGIRAFFYDGSELPTSGNIPYYIGNNFTVNADNGPVISGVGASLPYNPPMPVRYCYLRVVVARFSGSTLIDTNYGDSGWVSYDATNINIPGIITVRAFQ